MNGSRYPSVLVAMLLGSAPIQSQTPAGADEAIIEEVVVVGTRRSTESTSGLAVPVDILDAESLGGAGDMLDVLAARVPSYNVNREPISDAATLVRPANLRGLPADSTLILVNGKRRHRGAVIGEFVSGINKGAQGVDIAPLTPMALQRVEVLRDGASAQYGSDAIAGVINFVLEDDPEVRRVQLQYGSTFAGDGDRTTVAGSFGTRLGRDGFATISAELRDSAPTSRGSQDPQATYLIDNGYTSVADPVVIWGSPEVKNDFKVLVNAAAEAGVGELYGFGGWRGSRGDLNYDFSLSAGRNEAVYRIRNTVNASYGPNTPTKFDLGAQIQFERLANADFILPVDVGAASDLNVAFGAQFHQEIFEIVAGDTESWAPGGFEDQGFSVGSNGFQGFSADVSGRFSRDSYSAYLDLEVDATDAWLVSGALRYEEFSDFGDTANGKLASRFSFSDTFALRFAASTGFRAPSIGQSSLRRAATVVVDGQLAESLTLPPTNPVAMLKGGRQLQPEESVNLSLGAVFSLGAVDVSLDWFRIDVDDRIALTQQSLSDRDRADLVAANFIGAETVTAVSFFVNDIRTETIGADLVVDTGFDWAGGRASLTLAGNVTRTKVLERGATLSEAGARELEDALPDSRATLTLDYARGSWSTLIRMNYYDDVYEHLFNCETCAITTGALTAVDAELTWDLPRAYTMSLGVDNLFDKQPDEHRFAGVAGYLGADFPLNHPSGFNGGSYYLRFDAAF